MLLGVEYSSLSMSKSTLARAGLRILAAVGELEFGGPGLLSNHFVKKEHMHGAKRRERVGCGGCAPAGGEVFEKLAPNLPFSFTNHCF